MASLYTKTKLYLETNSKTWEAEEDNIKLQNDGDGDYIKEWSVSGLAKPTAEQIASYETAGNTEEENHIIIIKRKRAYGSWNKQMEMIYKDQKNGTTTFKDHCDKVRSDNPKG